MRQLRLIKSTTYRLHHAFLLISFETPPVQRGLGCNAQPDRMETTHQVTEVQEKRAGHHEMNGPYSAPGSSWAFWRSSSSWPRAWDDREQLLPWSHPPFEFPPNHSWHPRARSSIRLSLCHRCPYVLRYGWGQCPAWPHRR